MRICHSFFDGVIMSSSNDYLIYILDLLREIPDITYKKMMGEYILYKNKIIIGGIYDNRFLLKKTNSLLEFGLKEQIPYPGAKPMLLIDSEDSEEIEKMINLVYSDLTK